MTRGIVLCVLALGAGGVLAQAAQPHVELSQQGLSKAQLDRLEASAGASLLGQFRTSLADFLWMKADNYLHAGVELRGMTPREKERHEAEEAHSAENDGIKHEDETTVVLSAERDWRGALGNWERSVQPYQDMSNHAHADPQEALPLFRLMIWSNPHFIPAYVVGGMQIARNPKQYEAAVAFLKTGLERNDDNIEIAETLGGQLLSARMQRWDEGYAYLQRGLASLKKRNGEASPLTEDEKDALQNTYRWLVINRREVGDHAHARAYALEGLKLFPEDVSCQRYLRDHPEKTSPK